MGQTTSSSEQIGNQNESSVFIGSCDVSCDNTMNDAGINTINSSAGDITISQVCSANGQCIFNNSMASSADLMFKAANSAQSDLMSQPLGTNSAMSYQEINQNIQEYSSQKCKVNSTNDMNNVFIYTVGSQVGNETIGQNGQTVGSCVLNNMMTENATATGISDNCAASGKSAKKKTCKGKGGGIGTYILYFIVGMIGFTIVMMIIKFLRGNTLPPCTKDTPQGTACKPVPKLAPCTKDTPVGTACDPNPKLEPCTKDTPHDTPCDPYCTKDTPQGTLCFPHCNKDTPPGIPCYVKPQAPTPQVPPP